MRVSVSVLAGFYAAAVTIFTPSVGFSQTAYGSDEISENHRVLTVRPRRTMDSFAPFHDCEATTSCASRRPTAYDTDDEATDPFYNCISGCDIDVIFRRLTGRPDEGWKR